MQWFDPIFDVTVVDKAASERRAQSLADPRVMMYSCYDLGGADNSDDWAFELSGGGSMYAPIGLDFSRSVMWGTTRHGSLSLQIKLNDQLQSQWGCVECENGSADRVVMAGTYWGREDCGFAAEFLRTSSGVCVVSLAFINRGNDPLTVEVGANLIDASDNTTSLADGTEISQANYHAAFATIEPSKFTLQPGQSGQHAFAIVLAATEVKCRQRLAEAKCLDLDNFRTRQAELSNPASLKQFAANKDRHLAKAIHNVMRQNLIADNDECFSAPNRVIHKGQWLWDTCFHSIAWSLFDVPLATRLVKNLFRYQEAESGFIPINADATYEVETYATQPPIIAMTLDTVCEDADVLAYAYPKLVKFYEWFEHNRRLPNGLFRWNTAGESGMDNSPRFDVDPKQPSTTQSLNRTNHVIHDEVAHIDLSCMMLNFAESMASLANKTGHADQVETWRDKAATLKRATNDFLYHNEDGFYYDRKLDGTWVNVKTVASFWPLFAGIADDTQAQAVVEHIMNPEEFFTTLPLPSVAINEPSFCINYWRGPVWINTVYMTAVGMKRYGYHSQAEHIIARVSDGILREYYRTGRFWELYDPVGGPSESAHKKNFGPRKNANGFCGWTANVLNMVRMSYSKSKS